MNNYIAPFASELKSIELAGGKGSNLAKLTLAGFPVPPGFIITTNAYKDFLHKHKLEARIWEILETLNYTSTEALEAASVTIRQLFQDNSLQPDLAREILSAYHSLGSSAVAIRSSATAEDLADISFAGQQDTYLNVIGDEALLESARSCWGSLWTARAISYRYHNQVVQSGLAIAVIVQQMVQSEVCGVTFTANPLNGIRSQTVINASLGLGEALVSGKVDPDQYIVDRETMQIISKTIGVKSLSIRSSKGGGTKVVIEERDNFQALGDTQIIELTRISQEVANFYGEPQDIEWGTLDGKIYLLQSRPITSLFPLPEGLPAHPLRVFGSFAAVQGVVNPITPLGQQTLLLLLIGGARDFGYHLTMEDHRPFWFAGERIWSDITSIIKNSSGQQLAPKILSFVEPTLRQIVLELVKDPRLQPERQGIRLVTMIKLVRFLLPVAWNVLLNMISPEKRRTASTMWLENVIHNHASKIQCIQGPRDQKLTRHIAHLEELTPLIQVIFPRLVSLVATGMASLNFSAQAIAKIKSSSLDEKERNDRLYLELTRGLPNNVTTEMDLALWDCARTIQSDPVAFDTIDQEPVENLIKSYSEHSLPDKAQTVLDDFMARYQLRGVGEIDIGRERWKENPAQIIQTVQSYLKITDPSRAPDEVFRRGAIASRNAQNSIIELLRGQRHGWFKQRIARAFMRRYRAFGGLRETPKFSIIRITGAIRMGLLECGADYVRDGILEYKDDLFFLRISELKELAAGVQKDWKTVIRQRRIVDEREKGRRQIPRLFLSDGQAFYEGMSNPFPESDQILLGAPVSPGIAEGPAKIIFDPRQTSLSPGEILVCPGTDPAWTPLFLSAAGLVMEVGGLMTHGAVVSREYGIPAVVGVDKATLRIKTGQLIRVNGSNGQVEIIK